MALTKEIITICDNINEAGNIGVKTITRIIEDGKVISEQYHRKVLSPDADLTNEPDKVKAVARGVWTPATVAAFTVAQQTEINKHKAAIIALDAEIATVKAKQALLATLNKA